MSTIAPFGADTSSFGDPKVRAVYQFASDTYTQPVITAITFDFQDAILSFEQYIQVSGIESPGFGSTSIEYNQTITNVGWSHDLFGDTLIYNFDQEVNTLSFASQPPALPNPVVYNKTQFLRIPGGPTSVLFGLPVASNYYRWLTNVQTAQHTAIGQPAIQLGRRYIGPAYIETTLTDFGTPFVADETRNLLVDGIDATRWGEHEVRDRAQRAHPVGIPSRNSFGIQTVRYRTQQILIEQQVSTEFGNAELIHNPQPIYAKSIVQWDLEGQRFGYYTDLINENRYVRTNGFQHSLLSNGGLVVNGARAINPPGLDATLWGDSFTSHRIRYITPEWYESTRWGYDNWVHTRKVIDLNGWGFHSLRAGIPARVWSNLQTVKPYATYPMTEMGRPWVSERARNIGVPYIGQQPTGIPFVSYRVRTIAPTGIPKGYFGTHALETHQNIIRMWGYPDGFVGTPSIRNLTPEIHAYPAYAFEPGIKPLVQLKKRYVSPPMGGAPPLLGTPFVSDRTRKIRPPSPDYLRWGNGKVMFDQSQLVPPEQSIRPESVQAGAGVMPTSEWEFPEAPWSGTLIGIPQPTVRLNTIFAEQIPAWDYDMTDNFGTPFVRSMVIFIPPGPSLGSIGKPQLLGGTQWVKPPAMLVAHLFGNTRVVGPQYVRCGEQRNTLTNEWYPFDYHTKGDAYQLWYDWVPMSAGPQLGPNTRVESKHRKIFAKGGYGYYETSYAQYGRPYISRNPQHIRPDGTLSYRRGIPNVLFGGERPLEMQGWTDTVFGVTELLLQDIGTKYIHPDGLVAPALGVGRIELKHRRVYPSGVAADQTFAGASYVGPYLRIYPKSYIEDVETGEVLLDTMTTFGTQFVAYRIRNVEQLDITDDEPEWFGPRLKHQARGYFIPGTPMGSFGRPNISSGSRTLYPSGWEEFETGFSFVPVYYPGLSKMKSQNFIANGSILFTEIGNANVTHS